MTTLPNNTVILYKPRSAAWIAEGKAVKQVSAIYASTIKIFAFTTRIEAEAKAAETPAKAGIK